MGRAIIGGHATARDLADLERLGAPGRAARSVATISRMSDPLAQKWICEPCGMIYDPVEGDPDGGVDPGTAFDDVPDNWVCPVCGARKRDFVPLDE